MSYKGHSLPDGSVEYVDNTKELIHIRCKCGRVDCMMTRDGSIPICDCKNMEYRTIRVTIHD